MAQTKKNRKTSPDSRREKAQKRAARRSPGARRAAAVVCLFLGIFSLLGHFGASGVFVGLFTSLLKGLLGWGAYAATPALFFAAAILGLASESPVRLRAVCALLIPVAAGALAHLFSARPPEELSFGMVVRLWSSGLAMESGGALGGSIAEAFEYLFSRAGAAAVLVCSSAFLLLASVNRTAADIAGALRRRAERRAAGAEAAPEAPQRPEAGACQPAVAARPSRRRAIDIPLDEPVSSAAAGTVKIRKDVPLFDSTPRVRPPDEVLKEASSDAQQVAGDRPPAAAPAGDRLRPEDALEEKSAQDRQQGAAGDDRQKESVKAEPASTDGGRQKYAFPPVEMLSSGTPAGRAEGAEEVRINIERLEAAFRSFGVNVKIVNFTRGPTVTRYEAELEAGVKLNRLTSLADDIALSLGASGVRIAAMPNKIATVGIEVPNRTVSKVHLRDIIESPEFKNSLSKLTFAVGKNISGEAVVGDIARLPHLLVAGTTGSGKSVCLNSIILSILYKASPEEVRFIMIDPKMVEFRVYNGIPHLLVPVVTDVKKAAGALQWAVVEMMRRYRMFSEENARDLESYNRLMLKKEGGQTLPQVVVVIDELADLMLTAAKEVEESICRVAQMGRAAGVHLVIATQSPRADVITGLMKANIPSRIALKVSSALESRIILDAGGNADKLIGNGDMLFAPVGMSKPMRIQGTWVSDQEREKVVEFVKKAGEANYSEEVIHQIEKAVEEKLQEGRGEADSGVAAGCDELLPQAVEIMFETGQASVSMLQRRLKLGYARAARIVDQMEQMGIVGPFEGSKPRQLLITRQQWHEMQLVHGTAPIGPPAQRAGESAGEDGEAPF